MTKYKKGFMGTLPMAVVALGMVLVGTVAYLAVYRQYSPKTPYDDIRLTSSTVRLISPNGGETFAIGDTMTMTSVGGYLDDTRKISNDYALVDTNGNAKPLGTSDNTFRRPIAKYQDGTDILPGTYKVRVSSSRYMGRYCPKQEDCKPTPGDQDDSDGTITITQGATIPNVAPQDKSSTRTDISPISSDLKAVPTPGKSSLSVSLQAPQTVMDKMSKCTYGLAFSQDVVSGDLSVDWGDAQGKPEFGRDLIGKSCTDVVQSHTYANPGTYTINVKIKGWQKGAPLDKDITVWEGTTSATVH